MQRIQAGTTKEFTWISSGVVPVDLHISIYDGSETLVTSQTLVSSGNGHYYANVTVPSSVGFYNTKFSWTYGGNPYIESLRFKTMFWEVD
jgi:hypothetical protein